MSKCFSCGAGFKGSTKELLMKFKKDYVNNGIERYFFRLESNGNIKVINKKQFKHVFKTQIKPNFKRTNL